MKKIAILLIAICVTTYCASVSIAQVTQQTPVADTNKHAVADTAARLLKTPVNDGGFIDVLKGKFDVVNPTKNTKKLKKTAQEKLNQVGNSLEKQLPSLQKKAVSFNLIWGNDNRYQPGNDFLNINSNQKFVSAFSVQGLVQAWGIPLNINYATNKTSAGAFSGPNNNLFKFDFNPKQFTDLFRSDFEQYNDLKKNVFSGLDLTSYAQKMLNQQITTLKQGGLKNLPQSGMLSSYLNNPSKMSELLTLSQDQIKQKLTAEVEGQAGKLKSQATEAVVKESGLAGMGNPLTQKLNLQQVELKNIATNDDLSQYLKDPARFNELRNLNEQQIAQKLSAHLKPAESESKNSADDYKIINPWCLVDLSGVISNIVQSSKEQAHQDIVNQLSHKMFLDLRQNKHTSFSSLVDEQEASLQQKVAASLPVTPADIKAGKNLSTASVLSQADRLVMNKQIDSVATTITGFKEQLERKGFDVNKMLQMQKYLNAGGSMSELESSLFTKRPANGLQSLFTHISGLKIGAFGGKVPGGIDNNDLFMTGTSVTFKTGFSQLSLGYGSVNDISSLKDAAYQNSAYNNPRNLTFISTDIKRGVFGNVKISFIGALNKEVQNSMYAIPTISSNNVALTVSKDLQLGNLGNVGVSVSKSTTVYENKYQPGSEAILNKLGGLNSNLNTDLFEALAFGFNHTLDIKKLDMADNLYFSYAGMGYQNPGNNGYGGARMKFGGSLKKSLYKNKLTLNLRTDLSNMPISYTSNDKWKTYQIQLNTRYIINRKYNVSLQYTNNATDKKIDNVIMPVYSLQKMQVDGNATYKIGKNFTVSHLTIGQQRFKNADASQTAGNLLMVNYTQSMVMNRNSLTANIFYNKEMSSYTLIGDMLNSELSYQYTLLSKISLSSGVTYLGNKGITSQVGIKQGVQLWASGNFDLDSYVDLRHNLISSLYPDLYPQCKAELSLKYHIKNR